MKSSAFFLLAIMTVVAARNAHAGSAVAISPHNQMAASQRKRDRSVLKANLEASLGSFQGGMASVPSHFSPGFRFRGIRND